MSLVLAALTLAAALAAWAMASLAVARWPVIALVAAGIQVAILSAFPNSFTVVEVSGITIALTDVFAVVLIGAWLRLLSKSRRLPGSRLLIAFLILLVISLARGIAVYGLQTAVNEARGFVWLIAAILWASQLDWRSTRFREAALRGVVLVGWLLVGAGVLRGALYGFSAYGQSFLDAQGNQIDGRILTTGQALVLLIALIAAIGRSRTSHPFAFLASALAFALMIVASQQRTVWVITAGVFLVAVLIDRVGRRGYLLVGGIGLWGALLALTSGAATGAVETLTEAAESTATIISRAESWSVLLREAFERGPLTIAFGDPFGAGYVRLEFDRLITYQPHNWYVNLILRIGIVGLVVYCLAIVTIVARLLRRHRWEWVAYLALVIGYGFTYNLTWYVALMLAAAGVLAEEARPAAATPRRDLLSLRELQSR